MSFILIENVEVLNFRHALRNMRNPKESWARSDTVFVGDYMYGDVFMVHDYPRIGPEDLKLLTNLTNGGEEHRKVLRTIHLSFDVVPWRGMWQEIDTYKVATVRNSCSTMHKLGHRDLVLSDFQDEDLQEDEADRAYLAKLNDLGRQYRASGCKDKSILMRIKHRLPEGFLQRAGFDLNYETALKIFFQRRNHDVPQWRWSGEDQHLDWKEIAQGRWPSICDLLWWLPYFQDLCRAHRSWKPR